MPLALPQDLTGHSEVEPGQEKPETCVLVLLQQPTRCHTNNQPLLHLQKSLLRCKKRDVAQRLVPVD